MFTRFSAPRGPRTAPLTAPLASLTTHAVVLLTSVGGGLGGLEGAGADARPAAAPTPRAQGGGERVHWVGGGTGGTDTRPGARFPIAYVVPGRGEPREGTPGVGGPRRPPRPTHSPVAEPRPRKRDALLTLHLDLPVPTPLEPDAAVLVAGVVASVPDLERLVSRREDFAPRPTAELLDALLGDVEVRATEGMRPLWHVDELPVALVSNPLPAYPTLLAQARIGGAVVVEFRIDSLGAVDLATLRVVQSTNSLFTQAVRSALPQMRFMPAQLDRHAVGITVRQPFVFRVGTRR